MTTPPTNPADRIPPDRQQSRQSGRNSARSAQAAITDHARVRTLTPRDSALLLDMLANPSGPNEALIRAARRHKDYFGVP